MTAKTVIRRQQAQRDIEHAAEHYFNDGDTPLEVRFLEALEVAVRYVAAHAASGSRRYADATHTPGVRFWPVKRFPYLVFYVERAAQVDVWRVLHDHRDLPAWLRETESP